MGLVIFVCSLLFRMVRAIWRAITGTNAEERARRFLNTRQSVVVAAGVVLVVASGLFPPYSGEYRREGDNYRAFLGYHFLFSPPAAETIYRATMGSRHSSYSDLRKCSCDIATSRVAVQMATILLACTGLVLFWVNSFCGMAKFS